MLKVPMSPGNTLAGNLLNKKNGINTAITGIEKMTPCAELNIIPHTNKKHVAMRQVPDPSPLYPSNMLTVLAKMATINGIASGYIKVILNWPRKGIVGV